jgi:hypothetical protein
MKNKEYRVTRFMRKTKLRTIENAAYQMTTMQKP